MDRRKTSRQMDSKSNINKAVYQTGSRQTGKTDSYCYYYLVLAYTVIAQSTAQGHLRASFTSSNFAQVEYNTKHAHNINVKHTNMIQKLVPSVSLL